MIPVFKAANGVDVPVMGLGTWQAGEGAAAAKVVCDAVSAGFRSFDCAYVYLNETGVGEGIKACGVPREELYINSKVWNDSHGYEQTLAAFDASRKRLGLDYLDQYLIHWPGFEGTYIPTWRALEKLYEEGWVRVIGVSNFTRPVLSTLFGYCNIKPMINQVEMNPMFQPDNLVAFDKKNDIITEAWSPLASVGNLDKEPLAAAAKNHGKSNVQVILRGLYQRGIRSVPKTVTKSRMEENINIFDFELTEAEMQAINGLNTRIRTAEAPDEFFELGTDV